MSTKMVLQPLIDAALAAWWLRAPFLIYLTTVILAGVLVIRCGWIPEDVPSARRPTAGVRRTAVVVVSVSAGS